MTLETKTYQSGKLDELLGGNQKFASQKDSNLSTNTSQKTQTIILDFDDHSSISPGFELLVKLREHIPNLKVTLFTVPFNMSYFLKKVPMEKLEQWGRLMNDELDWVEIAVHGFAHLRGEWMIKNKKKIVTQIKATENVFKRIGLPFVKIFKAPFWEWSKETEEVLKDRGYTLAIDRNNPKTYTDIPTYIWNWSVDTPLPKYHTIKGHGHMHGTNNGIDVCYNKLLKLPQDASYKFVSEYINEL